MQENKKKEGKTTRAAADLERNVQRKKNNSNSFPLSVWRDIFQIVSHINMQVACSVLGGIVAEQSELRCSSHTDLIAP